MTTRRAAVAALLAAALVLGCLVVLVTYGLQREYGVVPSSRGRAALDGMRLAAPGLVVAVLLGAAAAALERSGQARAAVAAAAVLFLLAAGAAGALGVARKWAGLPRVPDCGAGEVGAGPAVRPLREAQAALAELDHPAPFSGAGSSGVGGCERGLVSRDIAGSVAHYRRVLPEAGWRVTSVTSHSLRARRGDQVFALYPTEAGPVVRVGPVRPLATPRTR